jgi:hypothetical protein
MFGVIPTVWYYLAPTGSPEAAKNLQQSWRFDREPPKAVLRDFGTIDWILGG